MSKKIKLSFVGSGFVGQMAHLENYFSLQESVILDSLAEVRSELSQQASKEYNIEHLFSNHKELILNRKEIDGAVIVTRRENTGPIALDFLNNGTTIITEKPMCHTSEQALKLLKVDTAMVRIPKAHHGIAARPSNLVQKVGNIIAWFDKYRLVESKAGAKSE